MEEGMQALCSHCCVQGVRKGVLMTCVDCCAPSDASLFNTTANQHHLRVTHRSKPRRHKQQRQQQASTPPFSATLIGWQARQRSKSLPPVYSLSQSSSKKKLCTASSTHRLPWLLQDWKQPTQRRPVQPGGAGRACLRARAREIETE